MVNAKNYTSFKYSSHVDRKDNTIQPTGKESYEVGQVVFIKPTSSIGVVLGVIDEEGKELRTDMDGMVNYADIEAATKEHFLIKGVHFSPKLKDEVFRK